MDSTLVAILLVAAANSTHLNFIDVFQKHTEYLSTCIIKRTLTLRDAVLILSSVGIRHGLQITDSDKLFAEPI